MSNIKPKRLLMKATVSVAAMLVGTAAFADTYTLDQTDLEDTISAGALNELIAAAVEGASNTDLTQVGSASLNSIAADVELPAGTDALVINQLLDEDPVDLDGIDLIALNVAGAVTTLGDAVLGGDQTAFATFNTVDIDAIADLESITLAQGITENMADEDFDSFDMNVANALVSAASILGTATIEAGSSQTAVLQINTGSFAAVDDEGDGGVNVRDLTVNLFDDQQIDLDNLEDVSLSAVNFALAYAPEPLEGDGDPTIAGLDQTAAMTINSLSFGQADVLDDPETEADEGVADTSDYTLNGLPYGELAEFDGIGGPLPLGVEDGDGFDWEFGQDYDGDGENLILNNTAIATTIGDLLDDNVDGNGFFFELASEYPEFGDLGTVLPFDGEGFGPVSLLDGQQIAQLSINSVSSTGEGDLTINASPIPRYIETTDPIAYDPTDPTVATAFAFEPAKDGDDNPLFYFAQFEQEIDDVDIGGGPFTNILLAATYEGDATIAGAAAIEAEGETPAVDAEPYLQVASVRANTISSAGDLIFGDDLIEAEQEIDDFDIGFGLINGAAAYTENGNASISDLTQSSTLVLNSVNAAGQISGAPLVQDMDGDGNTFRVGNLASAGEPFLAGLGTFPQLSGTASLDNVVQMAQVDINRVTTGTLGGIDISQNADDIDIFVANAATAAVTVGALPLTGNTASIDGAVQSAIARVNSIAVNTPSN